MKRTDIIPVSWQILPGLSEYITTLERMEITANAIYQGQAPEQIWLLEHPSLLTAGTSANPTDLLEAARFCVHQTGRGGQYTYHGPGQRVIYVMLDLNKRRQDVRAFVNALETWVRNTLMQFNIKSQVHEDRVGVWIKRPEKPPLDDGTTHEDKIAAIGIRIRKWVTFHGISINVEPQLEHYSAIVPCGVKGHGITSLVDLGLPVGMDDLDAALRTEFEVIFGPIE